MKKPNRIFEIDALRGICIIGMVGVHLWMNYCDFFMSSRYPAFLQFFLDFGGILFVILSGIAVTLGHHPIRRGCIVFAAGLICTAVTYGADALGLGVMPIWFGILHCLGACMLLSPLLLKLPRILLPLVGSAVVGLGLLTQNNYVTAPYLFPLGLQTDTFTSGDYFPLIPYLGWFILGIFIGVTAYKNKTTLLPKVKSNCAPIKALCFCGRHSLWIYLAHQPILYGIFYLIQ